MADLMRASFNFSELFKKYEGMKNPLLQINTDGKELVSKLPLPVESVRIKLSLVAANMAEILIGPIYDDEKRRFASNVKSAFSLGKIVDISIGYQSSAEKVFRGYVAIIGADFGERHYLRVTMMDVRRLMMKSGSRQMLHDVKNYSDAVSTILKDYSTLGRAEIDATNDKLVHPVSQTQNDYRFIVQELIGSGKTDREFFSFGDKIYFRKPRKVKDPVLSLKPQDALLSLSVQEEYENLSIEVIGYDPQKQAALTGKGKVDKASGQKNVTSKTPTLVLTDAEADTQEKANNRANAIAARLGNLKQTGRGTVLGLPQIVPGRYLNITDLESDYGNHKYYITDVEHEMTGTKFLTHFEIEGWT